MNLKLNLVFAFLTLISFSFSQDKTKKELSLKDAVLQQYRGFAPTKLLGFSFVPNSDEYSYFDKYTTLIKVDTKSEKKDTLLKLNVLNEKLGTQLGYFSGFSWLNKDQFYVNDGQHYYLFDLGSSSGKMLFELKDKVENVLLSNTYNSFAYTIGNNIEVQKNGAVTKITDNSDKNIVSGQSIARNEFGISKGMFWSNDENMLAFCQKDETEVANYPLLDIESTPGELVNLKYPMAGYKSEKPFELCPVCGTFNNVIFIY
jgi:dipeptidyl-peptidase-4